MIPPFLFPSIKFAIREVPAFVGHSFASRDREIVQQIKDFLGRLGVKCDSGFRPEPKGVSDKVRQRIQNAELFVGIFTRRSKNEDGTYSTSTWVVEEKAAAIAGDKRLLLFVEDGVSEFGGLQGDHEYIPFSRRNLGTALVHAMDYVLAVTSVPFESRLEGLDSLHIHIGSNKSPEEQIQEVRNIVASQPRNLQARIALGKLLSQNCQQQQALAEFQKLVADFPTSPDAFHAMAHVQEQLGDLSSALQNYQKALDLNPAKYGNNRCYGRCLYQQANVQQDAELKKKALGIARRLFDRAREIGGEKCKQQIDADLFVVDEALESL